MSRQKPKTTLTISDITTKWWETAKCYRYFAKSSPHCDFSDNSAIHMYLYETYGYPEIIYHHKNLNGMINGYAFGKHVMDIQLTSWREDIADGLLTKGEILYDDVPEKIKNIVSRFMAGQHALITSDNKQFWVQQTLDYINEQIK